MYVIGLYKKADSVFIVRQKLFARQRGGIRQTRLGSQSSCLCGRPLRRHPWLKCYFRLYWPTTFLRSPTDRFSLESGVGCSWLDFSKENSFRRYCFLQ